MNPLSCHIIKNLVGTLLAVFVTEACKPKN